MPPEWASRRLVLHRSADRIVVQTAEGRVVADHCRQLGRNQQIVDPQHAEALRELNGHARENREVAAFLGLGGVAHEFLLGLKDKRLDYRSHLRRINALVDSRGAAGVAAALAEAHQHQAYSADAVLNLVDARARFNPQTQPSVQLLHNQKLLELKTPQTELNQYDRNTQ